MSKNKEKLSVADKSAAKKAALLADEKKSSGKLAIIAVAVALLAVGGYMFLKGSSPVSTAQASTTAASADGIVRLDVADFADGKAKFYTLDDGKGPAIRYFAVKGTDGQLHTAYDACDACWAEGKGYKQNGTVMVCQNCRRNFTINKIGEIHGGCNPSPLNHTIENGKLVIATADIVDGRHYFDLPKRN